MTSLLVRSATMFVSIPKEWEEMEAYAQKGPWLSKFKDDK